MPQLTRAAIHHGLSARFFRWAYQAKVMNMLEATSSRTVFTTGSTRSLSGSTDCGPFQSCVDEKASACAWDPGRDGKKWRYVAVSPCKSPGMGGRMKALWRLPCDAPNRR